MKRGDAIVVRWRDATSNDSWMTAHDGEEWMHRASGEMFETRGWYFGHDEGAVTICHTKPGDGGAMHCGFLSIPRGVVIRVEFPPIAAMAVPATDKATIRQLDGIVASLARAAKADMAE